MIVHAGLIARSRGGGWRGVLVRGPSGSGKSDLALRAVAAGWRLVADDRVVVWTSGGRAWGHAPNTLAGLIEGRGIGVLSSCRLRLASLDLVVDAEMDDAPAERVPDPETIDLCGVALPRLRLRLLDASTLARLSLALTQA